MATEEDFKNGGSGGRDWMCGCVVFCPDLGYEHRLVGTRSYKGDRTSVAPNIWGDLCSLY